MEVWGGNEAFDGGVAVPGHDVFIACRPHTGTTHGGDVYYVSNCAAGIVTRFILADIAGHGQDAAPMAGRLRDLMRKYINTADQSALARRLNTEFAELALDGRFATAVMLTYFAPTDQLSICNAGHPRPLRYDARAAKWTLLDAAPAEPGPGGDAADNLPLGIQAPTTYAPFSVRPGLGDVIVLYSDALIEASPSGGRQLGESGLLRLAAALDPHDPARLRSDLYEAVLRGAGRERLDDDATLIVMHHNAADPPRPSFRARARILAHQLGLG